MIGKLCTLVSLGKVVGKTPVVFLYQKIILFASKKPRSCRNTCKNVRLNSYYFKILFNLWDDLDRYFPT
ncbi:hypothetical protein B1H38_03480 [Leptospira borgpetersenii serovar Ballum]|nr:hypothetical protein IQ66_09270 [Leptospira borgpetersenii serovar Ballum]OOV45613.1 hypothetical protein B1H38_03480 [Leptospira borgpetersenii serovar Ballum]